MFEEAAMQTECYVQLFKYGRNQALRIPLGFELPGNKALIRKEGGRLIVEPVEDAPGLLALLAAWGSEAEEFPEISDPPPEVLDEPLG